MDNQLFLPKPRKRIERILIITITMLVIIFGWALLTRAGYIENYLGISVLCPEVDESVYSEVDAPVNNIGNGRINPADMSIVKEPIIYLYPTTKQTVKVKLDYPGKLLVTYPDYKDGWKVTAYPDGHLINQGDNKEYSYLFWEGSYYTKPSYDLNAGFIVSGKDTKDFLQAKLQELGLNPKEYNEFIVYWLPKMMNNKYNLIHFASKKEYDDKAILTINPKPDSLLRVFMVFKSLDNKTDITPQVIKPFFRTGFSVIEWGGTEMK